jgi:5-methyltetrahydrofolate--homocysteine methyltransferase
MAGSSRESFRQRLAAGDLLVADGATATNYQQMGMGLGTAPEDWVDAYPEKVIALHRAFIDAGSDIILTNTFGGTALRLRDTTFAGRAGELNRRAAGLAQEAASREGLLVAGSMGPIGMLMEPFGELTPAAAADAFAEQAGALADGGVDLLVLETFFALDEALAAIDGIRRVSGLPLVVSFSFDQGTRTMMGLSPTQMVKAIAPLGPVAIGANCGKTLDAMESIVRELVGLNAGIPLWIKPNAGLPRMDGDVARYDTTPAVMADYTRRFIQLGVQVVGGCCGTTPAHLTAIADAVRSERAVETPRR